MYQRIPFCIVCQAHGACVRDVKMLECPDDGSCNHTIRSLFACRSSLIAIFASYDEELAFLSLFSGALYFQQVSISVTRKPSLRIARSHSASVAMCMPSITILNDGRKKQQIRRRPHHDAFYRPLSRDAYGSFPEKPPAGVVTARPSDPSRCPVPTDYSRLANAYLAGKEKGKARAQEPEALRKAEPVKKEDVPKKEIILTREIEKPHRRRRRSSASSASSRSWREMKELLREVLRRRGIEDEVRRQVESDRKRTDEEREQLRRSHERCRDRDLHGAHHKHRPRYRDETPPGGDGGYSRKDTYHWPEA